LIVLQKALNEENYVNRVISDFHDEDWVDRIIVIDGGSTDYTVHELRQWPKCEVYIHPWKDDYHDMEVCQSNIALSYVPLGEICFILDFDERCSPELKKILAEINRKKELPEGADIAHVSRRTYELIRFENSPYAIMGDDGWPLISHQIGQYPDFQCRIIKRRVEHRWINSPHHTLIGCEKNVNIQVDLIHYEKDDYRDRIRIEKKWARVQARRKELGLVCELYETRVKPEFYKYTQPEYWNQE